MESHPLSANKSMDAEYDRNVLKAVLFATRSHKEITELGINAERAVTFLCKTISAPDECKKGSWSCRRHAEN